MLLLGIDIGSSSVKVQVIDGERGRSIASTYFPKKELSIIAPYKGWAEQEPETWWNGVKQACKELVASHKVDFKAVKAIGISYQMHGLVMVDKQQKPLRPAIIWCDSRAVNIGQKAFSKMGRMFCLSTLLNSPGNFTASKLKWVQINEPELYAQIHKIMLPGDYIAMKLTGQINTTASGLSEGIFWDYPKEEVSSQLMQHYGFDESLIPDIVPTFGNQGELKADIAKELGLQAGIKVTYRAGDQPNNAFSLNVLHPGELAATAGTSGVVYSVADKNIYDEEGRVNTFLHVSNTPEAKRNGILLCVNGTGILYSWLRQVLSNRQMNFPYEALNEVAAQAPIGAEGLVFYPFGNGAERLLGNRQPNASLLNINFNIHTNSHIIRAAQEGIAFALNYGFEVLNEIGAGGKVVKAGLANMFLSPVFRDAFVNTTQATLQLYNTDGAEGAARGAGIGLGFYKDYHEAFVGLNCLEIVEPDTNKYPKYQEAYQIWKKNLPLQKQEYIKL